MPEVQNGAQSPIFRLSRLHGTAALVHDDAYHMAVPITWQCGGRPCHQHGRHIKFKRMANGTQNRQGAGRLPASVRSSLASGLQPMAPALRDVQPYVLRVRVDGAAFCVGKSWEKCRETINAFSDHLRICHLCRSAMMHEHVNFTQIISNHFKSRHIWKCQNMDMSKFSKRCLQRTDAALQVSV